MDLRRVTIQAWVDDLERNRAAKTACDAHRVLRRMLQVAVKRDLIGVNPAIGITPPKVTPRPQRPLTVAEVEAVADATETPQDALLVRFMAYTGLRFGEVAGLRVKHVNLLQGTLRVHDQVVTVKGGRMVSEPKSEAAKREIALPGFLADLMRDHLDGKAPDDHVFTSPRGGILHPSNMWDRVWRPALKRAGIEDPARLHDLRNTAVSFALASGASPKEAQALAGHASFQTTMNVYGHVLPGAGKATASRMDSLLAEALRASSPGQDVDNVAPLRTEKAG